MPRIAANGIELHYESSGADDAPTLLMIMGLGAQLTRWNRGLCELLVERGFRVLRFDNRDCGRSTHCTDLPRPDIGALLYGEPLAALPYTLETMAADSVGLLDALGIDQAHLVGASMGAAIAQIIAATYPQRALSLTSIMSTSGHPLLPPPTPAAVTALFAPLPPAHDRAGVIANAIARHLPIASPGYPTPIGELQTLFGDEYDRAYYPPGWRDNSARCSPAATAARCSPPLPARPWCCTATTTRCCCRRARTTSPSISPTRNCA